MRPLLLIFANPVIGEEEPILEKPRRERAENRLDEI
jgi:hypothetical protein